MHVRSAAIAFAIASALVAIAPTCPPSSVTRANCPSNPLCRVVQDADLDGEIGDDLRRARNELLYASGATGSSTVYLFPPDAGVYDWTGTVRFCGDAADSPTGEDEPDCDGTDALPTIRFKGDWDSVAFDADCSPGEVELGVVESCLHFGDRWSGGTSEPRPRVYFDETLVFRYVAVIDSIYQIWTRVVAVWLDGVDNSIVAVQVQGDVEPSESITVVGGGVYASATNSTVYARLVPGATSVPPSYGVLVDGVMNGSNVVIDSDFSGVPERPYNVLMVGGGDGFFTDVVFDDGCAYGPGTDLEEKVDPVGSCADFGADVFFRCETGGLGIEPVWVLDGDDIALDLDVVNLEFEHLTVKLDTVQAPGEVGDVSIAGAVAGKNQTVIAVNGTSDLYLDATVENLNGNDCYRVASTATVTEGPSFVCIQ